MNIFNRKKKGQDESELEHDSDSNVQRSWQAAIDHSNKMTKMMGLSIIICAFLAFKVMTAKPVTVVTPPNFSEEIVMIGNKANSGYKKQWGIFIASMLGNVNVRNVDIVLDTLKPMLSIRDYEELNEQVISHVKALDIRDQVQEFNVLDVFYDNKYDKVIVYGERKLTERKKRGNKSDERRAVRWTYELKIANAHGSPKMQSIDQYEGAPQIERNRIERKQDK
ncbi:TraE/TraK family type IV conjugative transfer system protein [Vibrio sp. 10N.261.52.A1]|uniref:TraE/TraK family type IV conjugative transfer system protein n=1 Tax=Vibrio TaxID=662 RepID=UPI000CC40B6F|nr:TraE/TraK family type IV conjugative transfer system protein [Vibrio sp. 10N.261.52.A1]PML64730.1 hypothetical protein BCT81_06690 [Vibrio sp. 10N.261.52.A1]